MIEYIPLVLTGLGLTASITYYAMVIRNQNKTRQAQLFMNLYETYRNPEFRRIYGDLMGQWEWKNWEDFHNKYGEKSDPKVHAEINSVLAYFEGIGLLIKKNLVDIEMVNELMGRTILNIFEKTKVIVLAYGRIGGEHNTSYRPWPWFEYLHDRINQLTRAEHTT